jgi:glycosyltransferase involved in cell wall biosynthesis
MKSACAPVKVLFLMDMLRWGPEAGGTEKQFVELLAHLDRRRVEPHVTVFRSGQDLGHVEELSCPFRVLGIPKILHVDGMSKLLQLALRIRTEGFQLVHIFLSEASIVAPMFCRVGGARVIVSRRDMGFWYTRSALRLLRVSNAFVTRMIANSDAVRANVHAHERYPLSRTEVIPNGHDPRRFDAAARPRLRASLGIGPADPIIGMVANFHPWKRHLDLVSAFADVKRGHPHAQLILVGSGDSRAVRARIDASGLSASVHILNGVTDVIPIVRHFDLGILPSETEGSSNAIIEYMGCGKPTVCTSVGGNVELIRDGENGFLVSPGDVRALSDRISRILASPDLSARLGRQARLCARQLTTAAMAERHMSVYETLGRRGSLTDVP